MSALGERFRDALVYAAELHATQRRKGSGAPYVGHLLGVASVVIEDGGSEDESIAALLHDGAEDQGGRAVLEEIRRRFGGRVAGIVEACSDTLEDPKPPWRERKAAYLDRLETEDDEGALRVSLADKVHNARAIVLDLRRDPERFWERFHVDDPQEQLWYYRGLADVFARRRPGPLAVELRRAVDEIAELVSRG